MNNDRVVYIEKLFEDNGAVELRILKPVVQSGLYDDQGAFFRDARRYWRSGHVYTSLNAPIPRKVSNRLSTHSALCDSDIGWITRLPFDFDPVRQADVCSTDAELDNAYSARNRMIDWLNAIGWPEPIRACSGNGYHAQYRVRLPNNAEVKALFSKLYKGLALLFSDPVVHFDTKVRNPSRIFRLYGSVNRKGAYTDERPHRMSDVSMPSEFALVTLEQIKQAIERLESAVQNQRILPSKNLLAHHLYKGHGDYRTLDIVTWFEHHNLYKRPASSQGKHFVVCPWLFEHSTPDSPEKTDTIIFEADGSWPGFYCSHAHCDGRNIRDVMTILPDADRFCSRSFMEQSNNGFTELDCPVTGSVDRRA